MPTFRRGERACRDRSHAIALAGLFAAMIVVTPLAARGSAADTVRHRMAHAGAKVESGVDRAGRATGRALERAITATGRGIAFVLDRSGQGLSRAGSALRNGASRARSS